MDAQNHVPDSTTTNISYSFDSVHTGLMGLTGTFGNPAKAVYDPSAVTQLPHVTAPTK
ncbi:hypothetical protein AB3X83_12545 [Lentilactobacillus buchneri]|uniref:hypothetical protein n=1 Tax=Lentilactobacillus buchneri TaxID=1581 RepID=UPI0034E4422A